MLRLWWNLIRLRSKRDLAWRFDALEKLGNSKNRRAVGPLIATLNDSVGSVREEAAKALGKIGDPRAVKPLIATLNDSKWLVRNEAAKALGKIGDPRAVEPLIAALNDVSDAAVGALRALRYEPKDNTQQVTWLVANREWSAAIKQGPVAVEPIIVALNNPYDEVRKEAAEALGKIGDPRAVGPLVVALSDSVHKVWCKVREALLEIGEAAVEPLIAALQDSSNDHRGQAVEILGTIGDARAVEPLIAALKDTHENVRKGAAEALGKIGDARAVEPLITTLQDTASWVRWKVAEALGKIGDARAIERLTMCLREGDRYLGHYVVSSLEKLGWSPTTDQDREFVRLANIHEAEHRRDRQASIDRMLREEQEKAEEKVVPTVAKTDQMVKDRRTKTQTTGGSSYWKCPRCGAILVKPMSAALRSAISDRIEGNSTCVPCGAVFSASDVYGGKYDVT